MKVYLVARGQTAKKKLAESGAETGETNALAATAGQHKRALTRYEALPFNKVITGLHQTLLCTEQTQNSYVD